MTLTTPQQLEEINKKIEEQCAPIFQKLESIERHNQKKVLEAFQTAKISDAHFNGSTGYGYDDFGREALESVYAEVFGAEAALVRPQLMSGTHAITVSLFGVLRPGDELMYITGAPYDTLEEVIGLRGEASGSLKDFGISCRVVPLENETIDTKRVINEVSPTTKVIAIQRSRGYATRRSLSIEEIRKAIKEIKEKHPHLIVFIDNCYGEFVEKEEPCEAGADLIAGSLIKNPGGGLVKAGGYIAGREDLVEQCAYRLTAPGLGKEVGPTLNQLGEFFQGFFLAPHVTIEALKGAIYTAALTEAMGLSPSPKWDEKRTDIVQSVNFENAEQMVLFCQAIQKASPINSHVTPYPSAMPGYESKVIMAAGTFVQGSSIELSADGPIRPPYTAFIQGGLTFRHVQLALLNAAEALLEKKRVQL
ncbi:methionine gamma-lyase family protein [Pullulanibacillus sp. KACC 23026]|uniref:methionine gamma-lyase family protein n=1 Tax=Pullulanibacillus sp. KACC 23026 TaxID=3028315 RepID=UPI0023AFA69A|nr:methionine gamma-lyase family protein [Pullulanibacillus sp. KACC 23026]WEG11538.1 methionine gamma-lyase family protein [Pullulanibacillus sp. KACC 23026]